MIVHIKKEKVPAYQCQKTQSATQDAQMETEINHKLFTYEKCNFVFRNKKKKYVQLHKFEPNYYFFFLKVFSQF